MWYSLSGARVTDLPRALGLLLQSRERRVHVGTDALSRSGSTVYVTVITVLDPRGGGRVFYRRDRTPLARSLAEKLFAEVTRSIEVAQELAATFDNEIVVHVDANVDERHRSSRYVQALAGMVVGYGFDVRVKPDSWCASTVADFVCKKSGLAA